MHDNGLYVLSTAYSDKINIPQIKKGKEMKRGDYQCNFYKHIACIKWYDNKSVMLLGNHSEEITSILTVQRRLKGSSSKIPVNCPNDIKLYNSTIGGVDLMDQLKSAYQTDRRWKFWFYLRLFFDLFNVALVNSFIVYKELENKDLTLKEFKICIALKLNASFISRKLSFLNLVHPSASKLKEPTRYLRHIFQFSWRQDDDVLYAPKQETRTEHLLRVHYMI